MKDWDEVVAFACSLPDVAMAPHWGHLVPKLNGKALAGHGRIEGSFGLYVGSIDEKLFLIDSDPDTFWQTPHYANYPAVLVRYGTDAHDRLEALITRTWWRRAKAAQRKAHPELDPDPA